MSQEEFDTRPAEWQFDPAMPAELRQLVTATGPPSPLNEKLLFHESYALEPRNQAGRYVDYIYQSREILKVRFYRCTVKYNKRGHKHWLGVVVVTSKGASIPTPTIISLAGIIRSERRYFPWYGKDAQEASNTLAITREREEAWDSSDEESDIEVPAAEEGVPMTVLDETTVNLSATGDAGESVKREPILDKENAAVVISDDNSTTASATNSAERTVIANGMPINLGNITLLFINDEGTTLRRRPWNLCATVRSLFAQAVIARIIKPRDKEATLQVQVLEKDMMLMKDDPQDFRELEEAIETAAAQSAADEGFDVLVHALEGS